MNDTGKNARKATKRRKEPPKVVHPIGGETSEPSYPIKFRIINPIGRPTEYQEDMCQEVINFGKLGYSRTAIAAKLGISRNTLYQWVKQYPEFHDAMEKAVEESQIFWEDTLRMTAIGVIEKGSATATIFALKSQFQQDWKDIKTTELVGANGGPVQVQAIVFDPDEMDPDEIEAAERLLLSYEQKLKEAEDD